MFANSRECGTAFLHRLAIQFSKTELHPSKRVDDLGSSPYHRGVAKTPVLVQEGAAYLHQPLRTVKRKVREKSRASSRPEEPDYYIRPSTPSSSPALLPASPSSSEGKREDPLEGLPVRRETRASESPGFEGRAM
jgi:hypothetical protein